MRNYSMSGAESPQIKLSKEETIQELKELNIFEKKKKYRMCPLKVNPLWFSMFFVGLTFLLGSQHKALMIIINDN